MFRNFTDAAITKRQLLEKGVRLVSAKEQFGDGYMGDAMEAITDIMNEVQVRQSGENIAIKMAHKVAGGGSVGRAKVGYVNARTDVNGYLVNTIDIDPTRAPLVSWAFEQYATGRHSNATPSPKNSNTPKTASPTAPTKQPPSSTSSPTPASSTWTATTQYAATSSPPSSPAS